MIDFLVTSTLVWAGAYALYRWLLAPTGAHAYNRVYLLVALLAGAAAPWLPDLATPLPVPAEVSQILTAWLPTATVSASGEVAPNVAATWSWRTILAGVYLFGLATCASFFVRRWLRLRRLANEARRLPTVPEWPHLRLVASAGVTAPCSWGATVFVGDDWEERSPRERRVVLAHEGTHHRLGHRYDVLLGEVLRCAAWFNPLVHLLVRDLRLVHEFQADAAALRTTAPSDYKRLLTAQALDTPASRLVLAINHSPLHLRFAMMNLPNRSLPVWRLGAAAVLLPLIVAACTKDEVSVSDLSEVAELNTKEARRQSEDKVMRSVGAMTLTSTDTIVMLDPETQEESVDIIELFEDDVSGDTKTASRSYDSWEDLEAGKPSVPAQEMFRNEEVLKVVDEMPHFPGPCDGLAGVDKPACTMQAMLDFVYSNIKYPASMRDAGVEGTVVVSFIVGRDGELVEPRVERRVHPDAEAEVLRIVREMPAWEPGRQDGEPVQVRFNLPVKFAMS